MLDYQEKLKTKWKHKLHRRAAENLSFSPQINSPRKKSIINTSKSLQNTRENRNMENQNIKKEKFIGEYRKSSKR